MYDAVLQFRHLASNKSTILESLGLKPKGYLLATIHRAYNTDEPTVLSCILTAFQQIDETIIFPIHPRTLGAITDSNITSPQNVHMIDPVGYLDMLMLEQNARLILTDSGGVQKEAYFFKVPCVTLRPETEWVETTSSGWNTIVGTDPAKIIAGINSPVPSGLSHPDYFGDGHAGEKIVSILGS
jgi:UDP-N-acetylglucosamine 2-epimerase